MFPMCLRRMCLLLLLGRIFVCVSFRSNWCIMLLKFSVSLLIFCLVVLFIIESWILKSPTIMVLISTSFNSIKVCFTYLRALMLGTYIYICPIFLANWPYHRKMSLSLLTVFDVKSILSNLSRLLLLLSGYHLHTSLLLWVHFRCIYLWGP